MHGWLPRGELDEALNASLGAANVHLHNELILCLLNNARCRYLPVELVSQVPASSRGKVVHATVKPPPPPPLPRPQAPRALLPPPSPATSSSPASLPLSSNKAAISGANADAAASSSPFQGERTEGILSNAVENAATVDGGGGRGSAVAGSEENSPKMLPPVPLKVEVGHDGGKGLGGTRVEAAAAAVKPEPRWAAGVTIPPPLPPGAGGGPFSPGSKRRRDDDRIPTSTAAAASAVTATATSRDQERRRGFALDGDGDEDGDVDAILEKAQLLEEEILCHFGPGSDLWRTWSGRRAAATGPGRHGHQQWESDGNGNGGRKRSASSDESPGLAGDHGNQRPAEMERRTKALKSEPGAAAGGPAANGWSGCCSTTGVGELCKHSLKKCAETAQATSRP